MVMSHEQWEIILGIIDQEVDLSKDNVIKKIKELLKTARILEPKEALRMSEEISHELETSRKTPEAQETQEPLKKRLKVLHVPQTLEESKKILKKQNKQKILERVLKRLGVQETPEESKAVVLEDVLDAQKTSEKVPVMLDAKKILEAIKMLKEASKHVYQEWGKAGFDVNYWFTIDYNIRNGYDQYPLLCLAIYFKLENVVKALKRVKGMDTRSKGPFFQWTPLHWAAEDEDTKAVSELIDNGANVDPQDLFGQTPLYCGATNGNTKIIKSLVQNGADVNKEDITKSNPLYEAADHNNIEAVEYLMTQKAKVKASKQSKRTPLHAAIIHNNPKMLATIIQNDNDIDNNIDIVDADGRTALYYIAERNNISLLKLLLERNADVNLEENLNGKTALQIAATNGFTEIVRYLIYHNADIHYRDVNGWNSFNHAALMNNKAQEVLLEHGADIETKDIQKILSFIYSHNYFEAMNGIIEFGVHKYLTELARIYNLHYAAKYCCIEDIHTLKELGVNVNASNDLGLTALHYAAMYGNAKVIDVLYTYRAGMNPSDNSKLTPLHYAAKHDHEKAVRALLSYQASIWACDICGERAIDLAKNDNIRRILEEAEKKEREKARTYGVIIESDEPNTALDMVEGQIADNLSHIQLEPSTKLYKGAVEVTVTHVANNLARTQLEPNEIEHLANNLSHIQLRAQ